MILVRLTNINNLGRLIIMTSFITDILIKYNYIEESERKTYIYCFSFITEYLLFIATSLIIGALFHNILHLMIFLTVFIILLHSYLYIIMCIIHIICTGWLCNKKTWCQTETFFQKESCHYMSVDSFNIYHICFSREFKIMHFCFIRKCIMYHKYVIGED